MMLINACVMPVFVSGSSSERKNKEEANLLLEDLENKGNDCYRQFSKYERGSSSLQLEMHSESIQDPIINKYTRIEE